MLEYLSNKAQISLWKWIGTDIQTRKPDIRIVYRLPMIVDQLRNDIDSCVSDTGCGSDLAADLKISATEIDDALDFVLTNVLGHGLAIFVGGAAGRTCTRIEGPRLAAPG